MQTTKTAAVADVGDYMKVFACTAVMMQTVLALVLTTNPSQTVQTGIGILYNFVKFTAPAFIFGILYTTTRTTLGHRLADYPGYLKKQWSALFVPTIWWTLAYLLLLPNVQQIEHFHDIPSFLWQFINGNAAPHLWYNTMMLQFIILMPFFWLIGRWTNQHPTRGAWVVGLTLVGFGAWLWFYGANIINGPHTQDWYLLDRLFISFIIYGIFGVLAWVFRRRFERLILGGFWIIAIGYVATFIWTNLQLHQFGFPVKLSNAPYYQPSMTLYALLAIGLIAALALWQINHQSRALPVFHFLATYAYRAYLSNVFWLQLIWRFGGKSLSGMPVVAIIVCYLLTWCLAFASAYGFHLAWQWCKRSAATLVSDDSAV